MGIKNINSGYLPFVQREQVTSPFTDIVNRAKVDASLKCIMGNERIHCNSINLLTKEQGPNGEPVYEPDNGDARVRFVGTPTSSFGTFGSAIVLAAAGDGAEITFYGTGLNALVISDVSSRTVNYWVDGASQGVLETSLSSNAIASRNYKSQQPLELSKGLTLGWHTIKITWASGNVYFHGFEILNEASQITVRSGKAHGNGYE